MPSCAQVRTARPCPRCGSTRARLASSSGAPAAANFRPAGPAPWEDSKRRLSPFSGRMAMAELWRHQLHAWVEFYLIVGGAAAALTGLMFVVVSVGLHVVTERGAPARRAFVTPVLVYFVCALLISACMTMPAMTPGALATLLLLGGI